MRAHVCEPLAWIEILSLTTSGTFLCLTSHICGMQKIMVYLYVFEMESDAWPLLLLIAVARSGFLTFSSHPWAVPVVSQGLGQAWGWGGGGEPGAWEAGAG